MLAKIYPDWCRNRKASTPRRVANQAELIEFKPQIGFETHKPIYVLQPQIGFETHKPIYVLQPQIGLETYTPIYAL